MNLLRTIIHKMLSYRTEKLRYSAPTFIVACVISNALVFIYLFVCLFIWLDIY